MRDTATLASFAAGALAMGYAVAALFFAKFWRRTRNRLFAWFAVAFVMLAVQRTALATVGAPSGDAFPWSYALRLLAFLLILGGMVQANLGSRSGGSRSR